MAISAIQVRIPEIDASFGALPVPVRETSKAAASFTSLCPNCVEPTKLNQKSYCPNDAKHGPFGKAAGETHKGREVGKNKYVRVTDEEVAAIKEPTLPKGLLELSVFDSASVEATTRPDKDGYFLQITQGSTARMLFDLIAAHPERALVGELVISGSQKLYRLTTWNGSLYLQQLIRPTEIGAAVDVGGTEYKERLFAIYEELLNEAVIEFDPQVFSNKVRERMAEFDGTVAEIVDAATTSHRDMNNATLDELEALLATKLAAKAPAKKKAATRKKAA